MGENGTTETQCLHPVSPVWALGWVVLMPVIFPPAVLFYVGLAFGEPLEKAIFLVFILSLWYEMDRDTRGRINDNVRRVQNALAARAAAANGSEPVALLLHSFTNQTAYRDEAFSLYERVDPAVRAVGFRPLAFGTALPLAPDHGVALITTSDDAWWDAFRLAARHAAVIFVSPERTASLGREISWLAAQGLTGKMVVLMAPEPLDIPRVTVGGEAPIVEPGGPKDGRIGSWSEARRVWREEIGVDLPPYDPRGAVITLPEQDRAAWSRPLRSFEREPLPGRGFRLLKGMFTGDYNSGAGVDLSPPLREAFIRCGWTGPAVSELWRTLAPPPLQIGPRPRFHPPGANGKVGQVCIMAACLGWSTALLFGCLAVIL